MLGAAPPPRLVNPAPGGKKSTSKKKKKIKGPREIGALESSGPIAYATFATRLIIQHTAMKSLYLFAYRPNLLFKIRPYKLGRPVATGGGGEGG